MFVGSSLRFGNSLSLHLTATPPVIRILSTAVREFEIENWRGFKKKAFSYRVFLSIPFYFLPLFEWPFVCARRLTTNDATQRGSDERGALKLLLALLAH